VETSFIEIWDEERDDMMDDPKSLWNARQTRLRELLGKADRFDEAIALCLEQHAMVHAAAVSGSGAPTFEDELWEGLDETVFRALPSSKDEETIAWGIWHISRIEDITMNLLVAGEEQLFDAAWQERLRAGVRDTGNAMTTAEMLAFSAAVDMTELRNYRGAVGRKTRGIIRGLTAPDLKRKVNPAALQRILDEGAVLDVPDARWLIDFWGRKNVAGLLLMPATRHPLVHLNEALRVKAKCRSGRVGPKTRLTP
jgi:hypothetical protein